MPAGEAAPSPEPYPILIGGKYRVVGLLGRGGQGLVYRAVHLKLQQDVAIKLACKPLGRDLVEDEGRLLANLKHPNLVQVHDLGLHEGRPYLVMEFVPSRTLEQLAEEQRLKPRRAAELAAVVARAVDYLHGRGVVHQDLKPGNILVGEDGRPRLIDFGMARLRDAWAGDADGPSGGTLAYMAPEQARGEQERIGPASDLFALGGVLYFLLTGRAPFGREDASMVLDRARRCDFDRSALRAAGVPRRLEKICLRAMAADPADRYATADDLARDLDRYVRRPRWCVGGATTVALLLIGAGSWRLLSPDQRGRQPEPPATNVPSNPGGLQYLVQVQRKDQIVDLRNAVPLKTGDLLVIQCDLPRGLHASVFWFDTEGKLTELAPTVVRAKGSSDQLLYPEKGVVPLIGQPGTELVLICANRSGPVRRADVEPLFTGGRPLPQLPEWAMVRLNREEVRIEGSARCRQARSESCQRISGPLRHAPPEVAESIRLRCRRVVPASGSAIVEVPTLRDRDDWRQSGTECGTSKGDPPCSRP